MKLNTCKTGCVFLLVLLAVGCAPKSYVVLLENTDGSVGEVYVKGAEGELTIAKAGLGSNLNGSSKQPFEVTKEQLDEDFKQAIGARPELPETFLLYFERGGMQLVSESLALVPKIKAAILQRKGVDISIIGHTDTVGDAQLNEALAKKRAEFVQTFFNVDDLKIKEVTLTSHGEKNLLVKTADNVNEPRNRRVEVTVR